MILLHTCWVTAMSIAGVPDPDGPVMTVSLSRGIVMSTFLRL